MVMGYEAITQLVPDLFFGKYIRINYILSCVLVLTSFYADTMGYAFTYPVVHYLSHVKIAAYVHYPTVR